MIKRAILNCFFIKLRRMWTSVRQKNSDHNKPRFLNYSKKNDTINPSNILKINHTQKEYSNFLGKSSDTESNMLNRFFENADNPELLPLN